MSDVDVFIILETDGTLTGAFANVASGGRLTTLEGSPFPTSYGVGSPFGARP